jgi:hypothetical protein
MYVIAIYDGDPSAGAHLLAKGSATTSTAFTSSVYLSKQVLQVYIIKYALDGTKTTKIIVVGTQDIETSIGI